MYIDKIIYFSKKDKEADIQISDGRYSVICYAYPVECVMVNQRVNSLYGFDCSNIVKYNTKKYSIKKLSEYYAYSFIGKVMSLEDSIVKVGDIKIYLDTKIPGDILKGEYISFTLSRLDLY